MVAVFKANGLDVLPSQAHRIWELHSQDYSAGWLYLPETDSGLWRILSKLPTWEIVSHTTDCPAEPRR